MVVLLYLYLIDSVKKYTYIKLRLIVIWNKKTGNFFTGFFISFNKTYALGQIPS